MSAGGTVILRLLEVFGKVGRIQRVTGITRVSVKVWKEERAMMEEAFVTCVQICGRNV